MSWPNIIARLDQGESVTINPSGQSMTPRIKSRQAVTISPLGSTPVEVGMIVLAKVKGRHYLHLVSARSGDKVQISNNHGHINGWTTVGKVFGHVTKIGD